MEKVRLGDVFSLIRNGANIKQGLDDSGYPITRIETISDRTVNREKMGYAGITDVSKYDDYILQDGDILMSHINSEKHLGKTAIYKKQNDEKIIHGMNLLCLRPDEFQVLPKYAFYFLSSNSFFRQISNITKKSVNQASFTVTALKELFFSKCPIDEQKKIICELDKITDLIDKRKQQLEKLDELVKARFVELFGDGNYSQTPLIQLIVEGAGLSYGIIVPGDNIEDGVPMVRPSDFKKDELCLDNVYKVAPEIEAKYARTRLIGDEILVQVIGQPGQIMLSDSRCKGMNVTRNLAVVRPDCTRINRIYLKTYMQSQEAQAFMLGETKQSTLKQLPLSRLKELVIPVPLMALQNQFAIFVEQTDKSKLEIQKSLEKLELLKKALMQKYFG